MLIRSIEYSNSVSGLHVTKTTFDKLTLLVGASGMGKTMILKSLYKMIQCMADHKLRGLDAWGDKFSTNAHFTMKFDIRPDVAPKRSFHSIGAGEPEEEIQHCRWSFKTKPVGWTNSPISQLSISEETLHINGEEIFRRADDEIVMAGFGRMPKISPDRSALSIFKSEPNIIHVNEQLKQVFMFEAEPDLNNYLPASSLDSLKEYVSANYAWFVNDTTFNILSKLAILYYVFPDIVERVKEHYTRIFPTVQDLRADIIGDFIMLEIRESDRWIPQNEISYGMLKTLAHIVNIQILPLESVLLIDELENSLGVNCIDSVVDEIVSSRKDMQFIVTSHHPYIINNIPQSCWKIVKREDHVVTAHNAADFDIGVSSQESFFQLMNALNYKESGGQENP